MKTEWKEALQKQIYPLRTVEADDDFSDLTFLKDVLRDVRIIGLGEGSHGTREHFQMKHRLVRFLVEQMGYRVFTIEAGTDACLNINDYVRFGKGDKHAALASQSYWTWDTEEVMSMIDWMREHNLSCARGEECSFLGVDMKPIDGACAKLLAQLVPLGGDDAARLAQTVNNCRDTRWHRDSDCPAPDTVWLLGWIVANEAPIVHATCRETYELLVYAARLLHQYIDCVKSGFTNERRDRYMAENTIELLNRLPAEAKVIVWAHNGHIANGFEWKNLGQWLREYYGTAYYALGFTLGGGTFQSRLLDRVAGTVGSLQEFDVPEIVGDLWECDFKEAAQGNYMVDLRTSMQLDAGLREWMMQLKPLLMLDEGYDPVNGRHHYEIPCVLGVAYDGIVYTEHTSRARPNPTGRRD